jgi:hypothetical protein
MSVVVLILLFAMAAAAVALLVAMYVKDKPLYGAMAVGLVTGPCAVLAFVHVAVA